MSDVSGARPHAPRAGRRHRRRPAPGCAGTTPAVRRRPAASRGLPSDHRAAMPGTPVPGPAPAVVARLRGHDEAGLGTLLGSNISNGAVVLAVAAVISPVAAGWREVATALAFGAGGAGASPHPAAQRPSSARAPRRAAAACSTPCASPRSCAPRRALRPPAAAPRPRRRARPRSGFTRPPRPGGRPTIRRACRQPDAPPGPRRAARRGGGMPPPQGDAPTGAHARRAGRAFTPAADFPRPPAHGRMRSVAGPVTRRSHR